MMNLLTKIEAKFHQQKFTNIVLFIGQLKYTEKIKLRVKLNADKKGFNKSSKLTFTFPK